MVGVARAARLAAAVAGLLMLRAGDAGDGGPGPEQAAAFAVLVAQGAGEVVEGVQVDRCLQLDGPVQDRRGQAEELHGHLGERRRAVLVQRRLLGGERAVEAESDAVGVGHVVGEQRVGDEDDGGGAAVGGGLQ
uniref:Uncharacterized protein n=1 Tax=Streptomyces avermitilis TaxID=33903 RepID=A0A499VNJ5_STRAX|nr:hypothetical protein SAVMC3_78910 [Streptomyces avermitilis]